MEPKSTQTNISKLTRNELANEDQDQQSDPTHYLHQYNQSSSQSPIRSPSLQLPTSYSSFRGFQNLSQRNELQITQIQNNQENRQHENGTRKAVKKRNGPASKREIILSFFNHIDGRNYSCTKYQKVIQPNGIDVSNLSHH
ncbi:hypothetical protein ACTA71_010828 [Dictyostelium dimigraforme]